MARITDINSLYDFIGYVVLCAPNNFPHRDYLPTTEQMNLERAFNELQNSIVLIEKDFPQANADGKLSKLLDESLAFYNSNNEVKAAHRLQDFQNAIFKK